MSLEGPQVRYARAGELPPHVQSEDTLERALDLARQLEELLEDTRSVAVVPGAPEDARTHSTRMARAMAAGLVDELQVLVRPARPACSS